MGKYTDAYNSLRKKPVKPTLPSSTSSLTRRFEGLNLKPSLEPRKIEPTVTRTQLTPYSQRVKPITAITTPTRAREPQPTFLSPTKPITPSLEEQRLQRDIRATGRTVPEITASGQRILGRSQGDTTQKTLESIGRPTAIAPFKTPQELLPQSGKQAAFQTGVAKAFLPSTSFQTPQTGFLGQAIEQKVQQEPEGTKPFEIGGQLVGTALQYITVSKAIAPLIKTAGLTGAKAFAAKQGADLLVDNIVQLPGEVIDSIKNDKTIAEDAKDIALRNVIDIGFNAVVGIPEMVKLYKTFKAKGIADEVIQNSMKNLSAADRLKVLEEAQVKPSTYGIDEGIQAKAFMQEQEQVAKDIGTEQYYKSLEDQFPEPQKFLTPEVSPVKETLEPRTFADEFRTAEGLEPSPFKVEPARIETPSIELPSARVDVPQAGKVTGGPIDTTEKVLTELPSRPKGDLYDKYDRVMQEVFSKRRPIEKIGGKSEILGSNLNRVSGSVEYNITGKQSDMLGNDIGKSVVDIFSDVPKESKTNLFDYIFHKHNIDRFAQGKPVFGETVDSATSARKVAEYEANNPEFIDKQQDIRQYFKNLLNEWGVKSGSTSQETAKMLDDLYQNYVPTYRARDFPQSIVSSNQNVAQVIKKAKGGESQILPLDQQMIMLTDKFVKNARKNELMNSIASQFETNPEGLKRYVKEIRGGEQKAVDGLLDIGSNLDELPKASGNDFIVNFYQDGVPKEMVVNKTMYKALEDSQSDHVFSQIGSIVNKYATQPFKELITGKNPIFALSNIMRDVPTALTYSKNPVKMVQQAPEAVKEMLTNGEMWRKFKAMGGTREGLIGSGKTFKVPNLNEQKGIAQAVKKANPIKTIGDINNFTESLPRFSEFMAVLKETGDPALAIYKSAELTTDFARHGGLTKELDKFVPYLNPSVQGIDKFFRSFKKSPIKTAVAGGSVITVPSLILDQVNKDNEAYNNLSPRERNLYFQVPIPDSDKFLRIPKSRELGVAFSSIAEWAARASRGQKVTGEEIKQAIEENFTPTDITAPIWTSAMKAWKQIKDPDAYETNYWGGLIVPQSQRKYSPGEQYDINSSGIAKAIGQKFEISPYVIDYFIRSYGGIIAQGVQPIGADKKTDLLTPLKRKFITDPVFKSDAVGQFYDLLDEKKKAAQDYNKANDIPSKVVTPLEREANALNKKSLEISKLRKELKVFQTKKDKEDQIRKLQERINKLSSEAVRRYK